MNSTILFATDDHLEGGLDLKQHLIKHPAATFFVRAQGASMPNAGILNGDLLIVDRAVTPKQNSIIIAELNGELVVKRFSKDFQCWGVVTYAIHDLRFS